MKLGEGLTGLVARERRPVVVQEPHEHPLYRYFKETGEERFHSFFGLPLLDRGGRSACWCCRRASRASSPRRSPAR